MRDDRELAISRLSMIGLPVCAAMGMLAPGAYLAFISRRVSAVAGGHAMLWLPALVALIVNLTLTLAVALIFPSRRARDVVLVRT